MLIRGRAIGVETQRKGAVETDGLASEGQGVDRGWRGGQQELSGGGTGDQSDR